MDVQRVQLLAQAADFLDGFSKQEEERGEDLWAGALQASADEIRALLQEEANRPERATATEAALWNAYAEGRKDQAGDCAVCKGSGSRVVYDTALGPDGESHTIDCHACGGTGAAPEPEPIYHLRSYGDVTKAQMDEYDATGKITGRVNLSTGEAG